MSSVSSWFKGLKGKLLALCALPAIVLGVVASFAYYSVGELGDELEEFAEVSAPQLRLIGEMDSARNAVFRWMWAAYVTDFSEEATRTQLVKKARAEFNEFRENMLKFEKLPRSGRLAETFKVVDDNWEKSVPDIDQAIGQLEKANEKGNKAAFEIISVRLRPAMEAMGKGFEEMNAFMEEQNNQLNLKAHEQGARAKGVVLWCSLFGALAVFVFGFLLASRLAKTLGVVTSKIGESGVQVGSASAQLAGASQQLSSGATEAAASLEETVSSLEELSSMVKLNADHAKEAAALSQSGKRSAEEGEQEIKQLTTAMGEISASSKRIEEIINVIDDIAFQTNILALNAAVEAARAGEQGKGFAVVAEAVRNLAQRSGNAAKEITTLIKDSVSKVENGTKIADRSGAVLNSIVTSIKKIADLNNEISTASQEQSTGLGQISKAMNQLDQATQGNAASAEEAAASSEEMAAQAEALKGLVGELAAVVHGSNTGGQGPLAGSVTHKQSVNTSASAKQSPTAKVLKFPKPEIKSKAENSPEKVLPLDDDGGKDLKSLGGF